MPAILCAGQVIKHCFFPAAQELLYHGCAMMRKVSFCFLFCLALVSTIAASPLDPAKLVELDATPAQDPADELASRRATRAS